jgi:hypothetical protein
MLFIHVIQIYMFMYVLRENRQNLAKSEKKCLSSKR